MRSLGLLRAVLLFAPFVACGRGELEGLGSAGVGDRDGGGAGGEDRAPPGDGPITFPDATPSTETGPRDLGARDTGVPVPECLNDCDCPIEASCAGGQCMPLNRNNQCCDAPFCPPGDFCVEPDGTESRCPSPRDAGVRDTGAGDAGTLGVPVGAPCQSMPAACTPEGFCIDEQNGFPDGYCSQECTNGVACPGDAVCRRFGPGNAICLDGCMSNADCRAEYACIQLGLNMDRVCWPIPPGSMNPNGAPVGSGCTSDMDCESGLTCLDPQGPGWNGGYCTRQFCDPQSNPCPSGSLCYAVPGLFSLCLTECPSGGSQSTCRMGYYCLGPTGSPGVCVTN